MGNARAEQAALCHASGCAKNAHPAQTRCSEVDQMVRKNLTDHSNSRKYGAKNKWHAFCFRDIRQKGRYAMSKYL
jgi:hypothetical protein